MDDRRIFPRSHINCMIWYNRNKNSDQRVVMSQNISGIGAMFLAEEYLPCNTSLHLKLKIPNANKIINIDGKVIRVQAATGIHFYKTAVEFVHPSQKINKFLLKKCNKKLNT